MENESDDWLFYFAYGSNMSIRRLRARVPSASRVGSGILEGHRLRFHKVGRLDGSGKCDAQASGCPADRVYGVVYRIARRERVLLDRVEGEGAGYDARVVSIRLDAGRSLEAFTYRATHVDPALEPFTWYKEHVLRGALENALPARYVRLIAAVAAREDPDRGRHAAELATYG